MITANFICNLNDKVLPAPRKRTHDGIYFCIIELSKCSFKNVIATIIMDIYYCNHTNELFILLINKLVYVPIYII